MQISSASSPAALFATAPATAQRSASADSGVTDNASSTTAASTTAIPAAVGAISPAAAQSQTSTAVNAATSILDDSSYSTRVGGKSYSADVSQSGGVYTLSVPNLPGASVSASSLTAAELALNVRIDILA